jgi:hypothetical protein
MRYVQVIDLHTDQPSEVAVLLDKWRADTEGLRGSTSTLIGRDRSDPRHFLAAIAFPSQEAARHNAGLPETADYAERLVAMLDEPPRFRDIEVVGEAPTGDLEQLRFLRVLDLTGAGADADALWPAAEPPAHTLVGRDPEQVDHLVAVAGYRAAPAPAEPPTLAGRPVTVRDYDVVRIDLG